MQSLNGGMKIFEIIAFSIGILYIIPYKNGRMAMMGCPEGIPCETAEWPTVIELMDLAN